jgi:3-oxoacyl-[acyl-carrier protein] reductase
MSTSDLLKGKIALITGCNRGIGKAIMETFAQNGADIWACARKQTSEFEQLLQELRAKHNNRITPLYFDLADESAIKEALNTLLLAKEKIDILVNNAGVAQGSFFQMTSLSKIREIFEINFFSQLLITQMIAKLMMKQKSGSIINLASIAGIDGNPGYVSYGSGKAALIYATKSIAKEFAANNVRVNAIAPGLTETAMADQMEEKAKALMINSSAMNRLAQPQEIANTALFLASDLSQFITGQVIRVDGGS